MTANILSELTKYFMKQKIKATFKGIMQSMSAKLN